MLFAHLKRILKLDRLRLRVPTSGHDEFLLAASSAVSRQIGLLETKLDVTLIERHARGVKPTEAGERVIEYVNADLNLTQWSDLNRR